MNMQTVNEARRLDSHTKSLSEQEKEEFEISIAWLRRRLRKVPDYGPPT